MRIGLDAGVCWILVGSLGVPVAHAELQRLDDADLSNVSGQTGISIGLGVKMEVGSISYFDDGNAIHLQGVKVGSSTTPGGRALHDLRVDIDADASLNLDYLVSNRRVEVTDIRFSDDAVKSMGGFF
ncbi:MAG: hypothetical protein LPK85_13600, partial [Gammaproteobacteria bacterium]|nr:hypothetical protein [Gammaproteobacteria bacterium]